MSKKLNLPKPLLLLSILFILQACSWNEINKQSKALASAGLISGSVIIEGDSETASPIYVQLYLRENGIVKLIDKNVLLPSGRYSFPVTTGVYGIAAFIDNDGDAKYSQNHWGTYYGQQESELTPITIESGKEVEIPQLIINGPIKQKPKEQALEDLRKSIKNIGRVVSLENPMFGKEYSSMGLWKPFDFADKVGGGLMMLQDYDNDKTPLLLIHGISGSSTEFTEIVKNIDHKKYQPWILYYPSGVSLDLVSDYMLEALQHLSHQYKYKELGIIAHSMGGLMTRSYVMKQQVANTDYALKFVITVNSPLYGMASAERGIKISPIVVQSWIDVAKNSEYVNRVHHWRWPNSIPYHLVFSYLPGEEGDGVVPLDSQLSLSLQEEAVQIHGFKAQHAAILKEPDFIDKLNKILNTF